MIHLCPIQWSRRPAFMNGYSCSPSATIASSNRQVPWQLSPARSNVFFESGELPCRSVLPCTFLVDSTNQVFASSPLPTYFACLARSHSCAKAVKMLCRNVNLTHKPRALRLHRQQAIAWLRTRQARNRLFSSLFCFVLLLSCQLTSSVDDQSLY